MQGQYCKCKNIYTVSKCNKKRCNAAYYWKQGIGRTVATPYPTLSVTGLNIVNIPFNQVYSDLGATATDDLDGNITSSVITTSTVDSGVLGSYVVSYSVTNSRGYTSTKSRAVNVKNTEAPVISIIGAYNVSVNYNGSYVDLGATALSGYYGDITSKIITNNPVNTSVVSNYTVNYNVIDDNGNQGTQVSRSVSISYTEIPVITLQGDSVVEVTQGDSYIDAGVSASSSYYGDLTSQVNTNNLVNTSNIGGYQVLYNLTDDSGNVAAQVLRTVNVVPHQSYWMSLARGYSVEPVLHTVLVDGEVYTYVYADEQGATTTLYRYIKTDLTLDAFYSSFDGTALGGLIAQKQIIV
tara:strand:+ start:875 stop:1930 length:1056 start_codon:yes stop_codon:yes gene_type:complete